MEQKMIPSFLTPGTASRKHSNFLPDPGIPPLFSADNLDYRGSGWSRGHMAPAGDNKFDQVLQYHLYCWFQFSLIVSIQLNLSIIYQLGSQQDSSSPRADLYPEAKHTEHSIFVEGF